MVYMIYMRLDFEAYKPNQGGGGGGGGGGGESFFLV